MFFAFGDVMLTSYFHVFKLQILPLKTDINKCLWVSKIYGATSLCKVFLHNGQRIEYWWNETFKYKNWHVWQYRAVWLIAGKWSSTQWHSAQTPSDVNKVEDLALGQKDQLRKQFAMENCVTDKHIFGFSHQFMCFNISSNVSLQWWNP